MKHDKAPVDCPDPQCDNVAVIMAMTALGGDIATDEQSQLLTYLSTCDRCRLRLDGYAGVAQKLPLSASEVEPPPALRERVLSSSQLQTLPQRRLRARRRVRDWRTPLISAFAIVCLALALLLGQQQALVQQQQAQLAQQQQLAARNREVAVAAFGNDDAHESRLIATALAPTASGRVLVSPSAPAVVIYARQLPQPATGRVYEAWLQSGDAVQRLGTLKPDANGRAWALLQPDTTLPPPDAIFVTEEPVAGGLQPAGPELLRAAFP